MYVIVEMGPMNGIHGVFGPFNSMQDEELKKVLKEKGLMPSYESEVKKVWYSKPNAIAAVVCEVNSDFSQML